MYLCKKLEGKVLILNHSFVVVEMIIQRKNLSVYMEQVKSNRLMFSQDHQKWIISCGHWTRQ